MTKPRAHLSPQPVLRKPQPGSTETSLRSGALAARKPLAAAGRRIQQVHDLGSRTGPLTRGFAGA
jgi:hypothetical protein